MGKKDWFFSAKVFTSLILIIFPISYWILSMLTGFPELPFIGYLLFFISIESMVIPFPPIPLLIALLIFAFYPSIYSTPKFFKKRGYENVILEYQYIKIILFSSIIILITILFVYFILQNHLYSSLRETATDQTIINLEKQIQTLEKQIQTKLNLSDITNKSNTNIDEIITNNINNSLNTLYKNDSFKKLVDEQRSLIDLRMSAVFPYSIPFHKLGTPLYFALSYFLIIPISIIFKLVITNSRSLFKLYFAKGCFTIVLKETSNEIDKAKYFIMGIIWYNKFLKKTINLQINHVDYICEKLLRLPLDNNKILLSISKAFYSKDGFEPLRSILTIFFDKEEVKNLIKEPVRTRIKESSDLIIPIITTIITIITTFFLPKPST